MGWVKDAHALKGEIYVQLHAKAADWLDQAERLWLSLEQGEPRAFSIERVQAFKEGLLVKLAGVDDRNASEALRKAVVFIDENLLRSAPGEPVFLHQLLGFAVFDKGQPVGEVSGFATNGSQDLLEIRREGAAQALVPLVDAYILSIDFDKRVLLLDLPEGLLNLEDS